MLLQDKYNIGVLTLNIEFMWLGKPRHINSIFTVNTPILYIYIGPDIVNCVKSTLLNS